MKLGLGRRSTWPVKGVSIHGCPPKRYASSGVLRVGVHKCSARLFSREGETVCNSIEGFRGGHVSRRSFRLERTYNLIRLDGCMGDGGRCISRHVTARLVLRCFGAHLAYSVAAAGGLHVLFLKTKKRFKKGLFKLESPLQRMFIRVYSG